MSAKKLEMTVVGIGPFKTAATFQFSPGFNDIEGKCGEGKTTLVDAILTASNRSDDVERGVSVCWDLLSQDDAPLVLGATRRPSNVPTGQITLPGMGGAPAGVKVTQQQVRRFGETAVRVIDAEPFLSLTRPDGASREIQEKNRLRAFTSIAAINVSPHELAPESFASLVSNIPRGSLPVVADAVNRALLAARNDITGTPKSPGRLPNLKAEVSSLQATYAAMPTAPEGTSTDEEAAKRALDEAWQRMTEVRASFTERQRAESRNRSLAESVGQRPDVASAQAVVEQSQVAVAGAQEEINALNEVRPRTVNIEDYHARLRQTNVTVASERARVEDLERQLLVARERLASAERAARDSQEALEGAETEASAYSGWTSKMKDAQAKLHALQAAENRAFESLRVATDGARTWDDTQAILNTPIDGATAEDVTNATAEHEAMKVTLEWVRSTCAKKNLERTLRTKTDEHTILQERAVALERAATVGVQERSREAMAKQGAGAWSIRDGVVCVTHPERGALVECSSLSTGQLDTEAIKLVLKNAPDNGSAAYTVLILPQSVGQGIDIDRKRQLGELAREHNVYIVTATMVSGQDLRVVTY